MKRRMFLFSLLFCVSLAAANKPAPVSFYKDVLPVLQKNCQSCHRAGEAAPMEFTTYQSTRPWAKAIREAVLSKRMPPWFASADDRGKFHNERLLAPEEVAKITAWVDAGAPEGNPADAPPTPPFIEGWNIGKPDKVVEMPTPFRIPASGTIEYTYIVLPLDLKQDTWIQAAEVRPGNRAVVHHVIAFLREPGSKWLAEAKYGEPFVPQRRNRSSRTSNQENSEAGGPGTELLVGYAPGLEAQRWLPGQAKLVKAGTDVVFQMHYTANGVATTDQTKIGLVFAKQPPKERVMTLAATNARFVIPPGAPNHRVDSQFTLHTDTRLVGLMPHMHLRGKSFEYYAVYPTGEKERLLTVPRYDFNWQLFYYLKEPKFFPKGTRIECIAHFDNSPNNKYNPDPTKEVRWGDQSWEEMMIGWFDVAFPSDMDPMKIYREEKALASTSAGR
ncbi:MAG: cytochrome c [Bryobacteraceae bacterium]|nr:cytochrome c [Bryobacteraceae bacterium]MDW8378116.1 cytochrome c [Bryobacterales bacterium]